MSNAEAIREPQLVAPHHLKGRFGAIARWTLFVSGALATILGLAVWPGHIHQLGNAHALTGWLAIVSLWAVAWSAARAGVARKTVWLAAGWGLVTAAGASAQFQLPAGSAITILHVATGIGVIAWGGWLVNRMRHVEAERAEPAGLSIQKAAAEFLAKRRIAVTGVSRRPGQHGSNVVYRRLRDRGYDVFAINPNASEVEGDRCYADLRSVPGGVEAVVIATRPDRAAATMRECAELGIGNVWMHRARGAGSVDDKAAEWGRERGIRVIAGGCPLMFDPAADTGHKIMRGLYTLTGKVPRRVS